MITKTYEHIKFRKDTFVCVFKSTNNVFQISIT